MNILIADDHELVRDTICAYLEREEGIRVQIAHDLPSVIETIRTAGYFDLILLDYSMPGMNGLEGLTATLALNGGNPVAVMSGTANRDVAVQAFAAGATGFLPKTMAAKSLVHAVRFLASGDRYAPVDFLTEPDTESSRTLAFALTARELDIVGRLALGRSNKEIAIDLDLREATVKLHLKTLCRKLGARNRTHVAILVRDAGLF